MEVESAMRHVISIYAENEPGVLARITGLFSARGFNIESLNAAPVLEDGISMVTITTRADDASVEQLIKQLRKVVTVVKVVDFQDVAAVEREMILVKVAAEDNKRAELLRIADIFHCKVVDVSLTDITLQGTGDYDKINALIQLLGHFGIREFVRTGMIAMRRSVQVDN